MRARSNRELDEYRFTVRPLSADEGGGYLVEYPDIPGCMSDGETIAEAIANGREALRDCLEVFRESGRRLPKPSIEAAQWELMQKREEHVRMALSLISGRLRRQDNLIHIGTHLAEQARPR